MNYIIYQDRGKHGQLLDITDNTWHRFSYFNYNGKWYIHMADNINHNTIYKPFLGEDFNDINKQLELYKEAGINVIDYGPIMIARDDISKLCSFLNKKFAETRQSAEAN